MFRMVRKYALNCQESMVFTLESHQHRILQMTYTEEVCVIFLGKR